MDSKSSRWGTRPYRLQAYLPERTMRALEKYLNDKFSPNSRVVTAVTVKALDNFLEKEGYLSKQGGEDEVEDKPPA